MITSRLLCFLVRIGKDLWQTLLSGNTCIYYAPKKSHQTGIYFYNKTKNYNLELRTKN